MNDDSIIAQLRNVLKDGIDYVASVVALLQARLVDMALSSLLFIALLVAAGFCAAVSFLILSVALGFWLTHMTGHVAWALLIIGGVYALSALICGGIAVRWLNKLQS